MTQMLECLSKKKKSKHEESNKNLKLKKRITEKINN